MNLNPKKQKYLIAFNEFKKIIFFGTCKIEVNTLDKCLTFETNATEERFKEFIATFSRILVQKENSLCIVDGISNNDLMVIFSVKSTCDRVMKEINKIKFPSGPPTSDPATYEYLFKNNFYIPILKEIQSKITGFMEIKSVLLDLVNKFEADQRQTYMNMVFDLLFFPTDSPITDIITNEKKPKDGVKKDETFDDSHKSTDDQSLYETISSSSSFRKRPAIDYSSNNFSSSSNSSNQNAFFGSSANKKLKISSADDDQMNSTLNDSNSISNETITASYEIVECFRKGSMRKSILIFTSEDKDKFYEFYYSTSRGGWHSCRNCIVKMLQRAIIKIISVENGKMVFKYGKNQHVCQPIKYLPNEYTIKEMDISVLKKYLEPAPKKHEKLRIVQKSNFKIEMVKKNFNHEKPVKRLTICDPDYGNQNFLYFYHPSNKSFYCKNCYKKTGKFVSAKLFKDNDGKECIRVSDVRHGCL